MIQFCVSSSSDNLDDVIGKPLLSDITWLLAGAFVLFRALMIHTSRITTMKMLERMIIGLSSVLSIII